MHQNCISNEYYIINCNYTYLKFRLAEYSVPSFSEGLAVPHHSSKLIVNFLFEIRFVCRQVLKISKKIC